MDESPPGAVSHGRHGIAVQPHVADRLYCVRSLIDTTWDDWHAMPVVHVPVHDLVPTQCGLSIDRLIDIAAGGAREGEDPIGHAVAFRGRLFIHDGHHDWALRWLRGDQHVPVRIKHIDVACSDPCCDDSP